MASHYGGDKELTLLHEAMKHSM